MTDNMKVWNAVKQPPPSALRTIQAGRIKGMTDVNPQWRYQVMTEQFGMCGVGWKYEVLRVWNESLADGQVLAFAEILLKVKHGDEWVDIPGIGGSMLVSKETAGLHASDEGYKMAITDALSVAMKMLGIAADVYAGRWDGTKYKDTVETRKPPQQTTTELPPEATKSATVPPKVKMATMPQIKKIFTSAKAIGYKEDEVRAIMVMKFKVESTKALTMAQASQLIEMIERGEGMKDERKPIEKTATTESQANLDEEGLFE